MKSRAFFESRCVADPSTGCWNWSRHLTRKGYGRFRDAKKLTLAHRGAWMAFVGPIPPGLCACHKCDNPRCCNPDHLFLGTQADNTHDKVAKGRQPKGSANGKSKLTEVDVAIIKMLIGLGVQIGRLAQLHSVCRGAISEINRGCTWAQVAPLEIPAWLHGRGGR